MFAGEPWCVQHGWQHHLVEKVKPDPLNLLVNTNVGSK